MGGLRCFAKDLVIIVANAVSLCLLSGILYFKIRELRSPQESRTVGAVLTRRSDALPGRFADGVGHPGAARAQGSRLPSVVSRAVWCSISASSSAPTRTTMVEIQIHVMKPMAAPKDP